MLLVDIKKNVGGFCLDVQFETDGRTLALLGASGSGKSMTLRCVAGVEKPDSGHIELNGRVLYDSARGVDLPPQQRRVGYLFQNYALFPHMTAAENVAAGARRLPAGERTAAVAEQLRAFRLEGLEKHRPHQLSGGQQQRVALARILAGRPEALLLDEPLSALDSYLRAQVELELADTLERFGGDTVLVSHDRGEARRLCRTVCVLTAGRSEPVLAVEQLMETPGTVSAAKLSGCKNITAAREAGEQTLLCPGWGAALRTAGPVPAEVTAAGIRAHHVLPGDAEENCLRCAVERVVEDTFSTIVLLGTPGGELLRMELDKAAWAALGEPAELTVHIEPRHVMALTGGLT